MSGAGSTAAERRELLTSIGSVAVVGVSDNPARPSHDVAAYLLARTTYDVYFVNPTRRVALGRPCYPDLCSLPVVPDLVDVFRRPSELAGVLDQAIDAGARVLWLQLGLRDDDVARRGWAAGLTVVMDRCLKVDHAMLAGPRR